MTAFETGKPPATQSTFWVDVVIDEAGNESVNLVSSLAATGGGRYACIMKLCANHVFVVSRSRAMVAEIPLEAEVFHRHFLPQGKELKRKTMEI